jgi:hypothetical protein
LFRLNCITILLPMLHKNKLYLIWERFVILKCVQV